jgi:integrase
VKDPALKVKVPAQLKELDRTTPTWDQLRMAPEELREMDRILLELEITDASRPGELLALRWKCFLPEDSTVPAAITKAESESKRTRPNKIAANWRQSRRIPGGYLQSIN